MNRYYSFIHSFIRAAFITLIILSLIPGCSKKPEMLGIDVMKDSRNGLCCNTNFPDYLLEHKDDPALLECFEQEESYELSYCECAKTWAKYNHSWNEDLLQKSCDGEIPETVAPISSFFKVQNSINPEIKLISDIPL